MYGQSMPPTFFCLLLSSVYARLFFCLFVFGLLEIPELHKLLLKSVSICYVSFCHPHLVYGNFSKPIWFCVHSSEKLEDTFGSLFCLSSVRVYKTEFFLSHFANYSFCLLIQFFIRPKSHLSIVSLWARTFIIIFSFWRPLPFSWFPTHRFISYQMFLMHTCVRVWRLSLCVLIYSCKKTSFYNYSSIHRRDPFFLSAL